jgi:hypothetical protein
MTMNADKSLMPLARAAERRLGRLHVWAAIRQRVTWIAGAAAAGAILRPFVWPLHHQAPLLSAERALAFAGASALLVTTVIVARAWRSRPSLLSATRRIDQALGLSEVVASGVAFEQAKREDEMAAFAITRAHEAANGVQPKKLFRSEPVSQPKFFRLMIAAAAAGILFGAVDRLVVERAIHPVTSSEKSAAEGLKNAAQLGNASKDTPKDELAQPSPNEQAMAEAAKRAAEAAERGDRQGAMEALEDMKKAERALQAEERDRSKSLRALRDELTAKENKSHAASASEALADLEKQLSEKLSPEDLAKLAERLDKAEQAAREAAKNAGSEAEKAAWNRAAEALKEAKEAAQRGDAAAAKKALEKAEKEMAGLENKSKSVSGKNSAASKMSEQAAKLDRSLRAGAEGKDPAADGEGKGKGQGEGDKGKGGSPSKGGKDDKDKGQNPGPGGGGPGDRDPLKDPKRLKLNGDLQARTDVREGEKAVSAIEGMGKGGDPKAYQEIFPAYDTVVEDGLREDNVPAARRTTVRRYFKSIRPGEEESK